MSCGYITIAQDSASGNYLRMAYALALSLEASQSKVKALTVLVTPGTKVPLHYRAVFDKVIEIAGTDQAANSDWKIHNKWKLFEVTPYDRTVLLDSDMLFTVDVSGWWDMLVKPIHACTKVYSFRGEVVTSAHYRQAFVSNDIPMIYTAFMYFDHSEISKRLFQTARMIYQEWDDLRDNYFHFSVPYQIGGDLVFGTAMKIAGITESCTDTTEFPRFVHMKTHCQNFMEYHSMSENWTRHLNSYLKISPDLSLTVGTYTQFMPFHYHDKTFLTDDMIETLENYAC